MPYIRPFLGPPPPNQPDLTNIPTLFIVYQNQQGTRGSKPIRRPLTKLPVGGIADIVVPKSTDRAGFLVEAASGAFDGCVVAYRTFGSVSITGRIDSELVLALPPSLRFICHNGAGFDQIVGHRPHDHAHAHAHAHGWEGDTQGRGY